MYCKRPHLRCVCSDEPHDEQTRRLISRWAKLFLYFSLPQRHKEHKEIPFLKILVTFIINISRPHLLACRHQNELFINVFFFPSRLE
jgi:hypothetical protein